MSEAAGGRTGRTGRLGQSGEHVPETAATQSCPAGCEAGGGAHVIPSLVFHHIHCRGWKRREGEDALSQPPALQSQRLPH